MAGDSDMLSVLTRAREGVTLSAQEINDTTRSASQLARSNNEDERLLGLELLDAFSKIPSACESILQYGGAELLVSRPSLFPTSSRCLAVVPLAHYVSLSRALSLSLPRSSTCDPWYTHTLPKRSLFSLSIRWAHAAPG
jgi:hypothetical protein